MSRRPYLKVGSCISWILLLNVYGTATTSLARTVCYSTPVAAIEAIQPASLPSPSAEGRGYRVTGIQSDPVLGQRWAMIASCDHPEWPAFALQPHRWNSTAQALAIEQTRGKDTHAIVVVRAGDIVLLWRQENLLRIEVTGISEESGSLGKTIRVRLLRRNTDDQFAQEQFSGIIRGPSDVEMQP
jgi:hypothetical protein